MGDCKHLTDLPEEVIRMIAMLLSSPKDVMNLGMCNKRFKEIIDSMMEVKFQDYDLL